MTLETAIIWISFSIGALATGLWAVLGYNWFHRTTGPLRVALIWTASYVVGNLGVRVYIQLENFNSEEYDVWLTPIRLLLNIAILALGLYLAKNSGKIIKEGEL